MEALLQWGLEAIRFIQQVENPLLTIFFRTVSGLGGPVSFYLLLPALFWCADYKLGVRVAALFSISAFSNSLLKEFFAQPRPFNLEPALGIGTAGGYGLPSGHAQGSMVLWGCIAHRVNKRWFWAITAVLLMLVGFSRVYLGVHFPTDIIVGWAVGLALLWVSIMLYPGIDGWIASRNPGLQALLVLAVPPGLLLFHSGGVAVFQMGLLMGIGIGAVVQGRSLPFSARCTPGKAVVRYAIGIAILIALLGLLRGMYPPREAAGSMVMGFLHAAVNGIWMSLGAPWLFRLLKI